MKGNFFHKIRELNFGDFQNIAWFTFIVYFISMFCGWFNFCLSHLMNKFYFPFKSYLFVFDKLHFGDIPRSMGSIYDFWGLGVPVHTTFPYKLTDELFFFVLCIMLSFLYFHGFKIVKSGSVNQSQIIKWAVIFSILTSLAIPLKISKLFSYIALGAQQALYGQNPYFQSITSIEGYFDNPLFINVIYSEYPLTYGPLFAYIAKLVVMLSNNSFFLALFNFKFLNLLFFLFLLIYLVKQNNTENLYLIAWNPLVYIFGLWNGSNNIILAVLLFFTAYLLLKNKLFWGIFCLTVASGIQFLSLLMLPLLIFYLIKNKLSKMSIVYLLIGLSSGVLFITIFSINYLIPPENISSNYFLNLLSILSYLKFSLPAIIFEIVGNIILTLKISFDLAILKQIIIYLSFFIFGTFYCYLIVKKNLNIFNDIVLLFLVFLCFLSTRFVSADLLIPVFLLPFTQNQIIRRLLFLLSCVHIFSITIIGQIEILNYFSLTLLPALYVWVNRKKDI